AGAHAAARAFAGVGSYAYVSSISAYRHWPPGPVRSEDDEVFSADDDLEDYGPMKAESERVIGVAVRAGGGSFVAARAGLIIGPRDMARRLTSWLDRIASHERVAVPDALDQPVAFVDARDLAAWLVHAVEQGLDRPYNATGPADMSTLGGLLALCQETVADGGRRVAELVPVPEDALVAADVRPWVDLPFWLPRDIAPTSWQVDTTRAHAAGLNHRPLAESVADTWAWLQTADLDHPPLPEALVALAR
ncbi:MAG: NAD-dependent epimerase/dehydratase family protein, partial [Actinomycetales bacterium]|nr:NAD-dependent epimerase/dehydratase family protein [Actinomycetales bacterium]